MDKHTHIGTTPGPRVDIEEHGEVLILRWVGIFEADDYVRLVVSEYETRLRKPGLHRCLLTNISQAQAKGGARVLTTIAREGRVNQPYVRREALVGLGGGLRRFLFDRFIALSGRDDIRVFDDEAEALRWFDTSS